MNCKLYLVRNDVNNLHEEIKHLVRFSFRFYFSRYSFNLFVYVSKQAHFIYLLMPYFIVSF